MWELGPISSYIWVLLPQISGLFVQLCPSFAQCTRQDKCCHLTSFFKWLKVLHLCQQVFMAFVYISQLILKLRAQSSYSPTLCAPVHSRLGGCEARRVRSACSRSTLIKTSGEWMEHSTESPILFNFCYFCLSLSKVVFVLFQKLADFCHRFRLQYFLLWWYHHTFYKDKIWQILD